MRVRLSERMRELVVGQGLLLSQLLGNALRAALAPRMTHQRSGNGRPTPLCYRAQSAVAPLKKALLRRPYWTVDNDCWTEKWGYDREPDLEATGAEVHVFSGDELSHCMKGGATCMTLPLLRE